MSSKRTVAVMIVAIAMVGVVAGAAFLMMNQSNDKNASYTVSLSYDTDLGTASGEGTYAKGELVSLKAEPARGYGFKGWFKGTELISTDKDYSFNIDSDVVITPSFRVLYTISANCDSRYGSVTGGGQYMDGDDCVIKASPKTGCGFYGWLNSFGYNDCGKLEWTLQVNGDRSYYADMGPNGLDVTIDYDPLLGTITPNAAKDLDYGTELDIRAKLIDGYYIDHWEANGKKVDTHSIYSLQYVVKEDTVLKPVFKVYSYNVSTECNKTMGFIHGAEEKTYSHGTILSLQAVPYTGYIFDHWEIDGKIYTNQTLSYELTKSIHVKAIFVIS